MITKFMRWYRQLRRKAREVQKYGCEYHNWLRVVGAMERYLDQTGGRESLGATNIRVLHTNKLVSVVVKLSRPGLLIGRGGKRIEGLEEAIRERVKTTVRIHVVEVDPVWPEVDAVYEGYIVETT